MHEFNKMLEEAFEEVNKEEMNKENIIKIVNISDLPNFLGTTLEDKLKKFLEYMDNGIDIYDANEKPFEDENPISKEYWTGGNSNTRITTPVETIEDRDDIYEEQHKRNLSPLQTWIENGKGLIEEEIEEIYNYQEKVEEYIEDLQDKINIAQITLNEELERLENLENLLETISI